MGASNEKMSKQLKVSFWIDNHIEQLNFVSQTQEGKYFAKEIHKHHDQFEEIVVNLKNVALKFLKTGKEPYDTN